MLNQTSPFCWHIDPWLVLVVVDSKYFHDWFCCVQSSVQTGRTRVFKLSRWFSQLPSITSKWEWIVPLSRDAFNKTLSSDFALQSLMSSSRAAPTWIMYSWFYFRANRMASVSWIEQSCDVMDWLDMKKALRLDSRTAPQRPQNILHRLWLWTLRQEETTTVRTSYHWLQRDEAHLMEETFSHKYAGMFLFLFSVFYFKKLNLFYIFIIFRFISLSFSFIIFLFVFVYFFTFSKCSVLVSPRPNSGPSSALMNTNNQRDKEDQTEGRICTEYTFIYLDRKLWMDNFLLSTSELQSLYPLLGEPSGLSNKMVSSCCPKESGCHKSVFGSRGAGINSIFGRRWYFTSFFHLWKRRTNVVLK